MAPVVQELASRVEIESLICVTAQHRHMLDQVLVFFDLTPEYDLDIMKPDQDLYDITAQTLTGVRDVIRLSKPDLVLVHGDTTTCFVSALSAYYEGVPVGHIEAGLRTGDLYAPFPEEANRALVGRLAKYHYAPTEQAKLNLMKENVRPEQIAVTGNTVIDALLQARDRLFGFSDAYWISHFGESLFRGMMNKTSILITGHRRENFGAGFQALCKAIQILAERHKNWNIVYPVHLNPNVQKPVYEMLSGLDNVYLIEPQDYAPFVWLMNQSSIILTDSGGVQEEAPSLGKPVLVMRDKTERPEAIESGTVSLVGTDTDKIVNTVEKIMLNSNEYQKMSSAENPYGDGKAAERIVNDIIRRLV